jgi:GrpB-like predicted nucleotidyltransferase (UPF0157 family)
MDTGQAPLKDPIQLRPHDPTWAAQFALEKARILEVLGRSGWGGVVWSVHHIGSTAIVGICAKPVIDILLEVFPARLEAQHIAALGTLGYEYRGEAGIAGRQFFRTNPRTRHLHVYTLDATEVHHHLLFRDYLRAHPTEAKRYEALKLELAAKFPNTRSAYTDGKDALVHQLLARAERWWLEDVAFAPLFEVASTFKAAKFAWCVASGWALEVRLGKVHRYHHDVDILVWRDQQMKLKTHLETQGWRLHVVRDGQYLPWLEPLVLPEHQIHAYKNEAMLEIVLAERDEQFWRYRRDLTIAHDLASAVLESALGLPVLAPEIVLLFKSHNPRDKDQQDFERVCPQLSSQAKGWLHQALKRINPEHVWLGVLSST